MNPEQNSEPTQEEEPIQELEQNQEPEQVTEPTPSEEPPKKKSKKALIVFLFILVLLAGGAAAYLKINSRLKTSYSPATQQPLPKSQKPAVLTYATKTGKTTKVYVRDLTKKTTTEEVSFTEPYPFEPASGNYWEGGKPSGDVKADGTELAYATNNNIVIRNIATDKEETIVKSTDKDSAGGPPVINVEPALPKVGGPGVSQISSPIWSRDGQNIGFSLGFYEGGGAAVINRKSKTYTAIGDTFRYINQDGIPSKFTLLPESKPLIQMGIFGSYLVKEYPYLNNPVISSDGKKLLATLCPADQPTTGYSTYLTTGITAKELADYKSQRDCNEPGDWTFISIDLGSGEYKEIGAGKFSNSVAIKGANDAYVSGSKAGGFAVTHISLSGSAPSESLNIGEISQLAKGDTIEGLVVKNVGITPIAEVYVVNAGKHAVKVVDLTLQKLLTTIDLDLNTAYNTLSLTQ